MNKLNSCSCGNAKPEMRVVNPGVWSEVIFYVECPKCKKRTLNHTKESGAEREWNGNNAKAL